MHDSPGAQASAGPQASSIPGPGLAPGVDDVVLDPDRGSPPVDGSGGDCGVGAGRLSRGDCASLCGGRSEAAAEPVVDGVTAVVSVDPEPGDSDGDEL
jgi:hypothetical protein